MKKLTSICFDKQDEDIEEKDTRAPYMLIAVKKDGNAVLMDAHSEGIVWLIDTMPSEDDFLETYCDDVPTQMGVYEWYGKICGDKDFETREQSYSLNGQWTVCWSGY